VVLRVESILTPPTKLELAKRALHELATSAAFNDHLTPRTFLAPKDLVEVAK